MDDKGNWASREIANLRMEQMNKHIFRIHNERVKPTDQFIHVGDLGFSNSAGGKLGEGSTEKPNSYLDQLKGQKIFLIGNHDHCNALKTYVHSLVLKWANHYYYVTHRPEDANPAFDVNFTAHCHNAWKFQTRIVEGKKIDLINVGIDVNNYMPRTIEELLKEYNIWKKGEE